MSLRKRTVLTLATTATAFFFTTAFGKKDETPPAYDPAAGAAAQAGSFIAANKPAAKGKMQGVGKVALTSCSVMFGVKSNAAAATSGGLFSQAGGVTRAEAKVVVEYNLNGMDEASTQALANEICAEAEARLTTAGFDVMPASELAGNAHYQAMQANGKPSPHEYKMPGGNTRYMVYAPAGQQLVDPRYAALGGAFAAAKGQSPEQHEARMADELQVTPVRVNMLVDFASVQGDGSKAALGGLASKDSAEVKADVRLAVTGEVVLRPITEYECWKSPKGGRDCGIDPYKSAPAFSTGSPVVSADPFYTEVVDQTTKGEKATGAITKGMAIGAAMMGVKGGMSTSITKYGVNVEPAQYGAEVKKYALGFLDMAYGQAAAAR